MTLRVQLQRVRTTLAQPAGSAFRMWEQRDAWLVQVRSTNAHTEHLVGLGEAAPLRGRSLDDEADVALSLAPLLQEGLPLDDVDDPIEALAYLDANHARTLSPSAHFALELAVLDWIGKRTRRPAHELIADVAVSMLRHEPRIKRSEVVGARVGVAALVSDRAERWPQLVAQLIESGYRSVKLKCGRAPLDELAAIQFVRRYDPDLRIRIDANQGFTATAWCDVRTKLYDAGVEFVEEPCSSIRDCTQGLVPGRSPRLALDESLVDDIDWRALLRRDLASVLVLKPTIIGGIAQCIRVIRDALNETTAPLAVVVSHAIEGRIAWAGLLNFAVALESVSGIVQLDAGLAPHGGLGERGVSGISAFHNCAAVAHDDAGLGVFGVQ